MASPAMLYRRLPALRQRPRRIAVVAAFTGFPLQLLGYSLLVQPGRLGGAVWAPVGIVLFSMTVLGVVVVSGYAQDRFDKRASFDERQRGMVDRALIASYGVLTVVIVGIAGVIAVYASFIGPVVLEMTAFSPWLIAIGVYVPLLPLAALAWLEPDAPADDDGR